MRIISNSMYNTYVYQNMKKYNIFTMKIIMYLAQEYAHWKLWDDLVKFYKY